jgi:hypothetical protein
VIELDVLVGLQGSGHRWTVHVLSRRGRYPETYADISVGSLWIVIPLVRGLRCEATAVPEPCLMAESVAAEILRTFRWETSAVEAGSS